ncbi:MAG: hypothetical protein MZV70_07395 [Desulfobacterales bacterium]|nr:hypothetical protein [Desulfobacterales bacterium]
MMAMVSPGLQVEVEVLAARSTVGPAVPEPLAQPARRRSAAGRVRPRQLAVPSGTIALQP